MASCDDLPAVDALPQGEATPAPKPKRAKKLHRASIVMGHAESKLIFDGKIRVGIDRRAILATIERRLSDRWTLQGAAGGIVTGMLTINKERYDFGPGWSAGISTSYRALDGHGWKPFVLLG